MINNSNKGSAIRIINDSYDAEKDFRDTFAMRDLKSLT